MFSRDDVTKRANYIGTRNGPHGAYGCLLFVTSNRLERLSGNGFNESRFEYVLHSWFGSCSTFGDRAMRSVAEKCDISPLAPLIVNVPTGSK